jgi:SAM-dependent methyltransferase
MAEGQKEDSASPPIRELGASVSDERWTKAQQYERQYWVNIRKNGFRGLSPERFATWHPAIQAWSVLYMDHDFAWFRDKTVVEIGCGPLGVVAGLEAGRKIGIDPLLTVYQDLWDLESHGCTYLAQRAESVSLEDGVADVVICHNVLDHVQAPRQVLKEIRRILKADGELYLSLNLEDQDEACHSHGFNLASITQLIQECGFQITKAQVTSQFYAVDRPFHFSSVSQPSDAAQRWQPGDDGQHPSALAAAATTTPYAQQLEARIAACEAELVDLHELVQRYESGRFMRLMAGLSHLRLQVQDWLDRSFRGR